MERAPTTTLLALALGACGCGGGTGGAATATPEPGPTAPAASVGVAPTAPAASSAPRPIADGEIPTLEPRDGGALVAVYGGRRVALGDVRFELRGDNTWVLRAEGPGAELLVPVLREPTAGRCVVRPLSGTKPGSGRMRIAGVGWSEVMGFAIRFDEVSARRPYVPGARDPRAERQAIARASARIRIEVGPSKLGGGPGGFVRGRVEAPLVQLRSLVAESACDPGKLALGPAKTAGGRIGRLDFPVGSARIEEVPDRDDELGGFRLQLFNRPLDFDRPNLIPLGLRSTWVSFAKAPAAGACIATDREGVVDGPTPELPAPRARVHVVELTPASDGKPGRAKVRVELDWLEGSRVTGEVSDVRVEPPAPRSAAPVVARLVDACE